MSRSRIKGFFINLKLLWLVVKFQKKIIKIWSRYSVVVPELVGQHILVHNGRHFVRLLISVEMLGHHFGEYVCTRKFCIHVGHKKRRLRRKNVKRK